MSLPAPGGLGRRPAPDERDHRFLMRAVQPSAPAPLPRYRHYRTGSVLDQGPFPHCVGFAWRQWLSSAILMTRTGPAADHIYRAAQQVDEWPGENYDGTSVRAGAKVLQAGGHIASYLWAFTADDVARWILSGRGTVVLGTTWYERMFTPDRYGLVSLGGRVAGGHAYLCVGYNASQDLFTCLNSWGRGWGIGGRFRISARDLGVLLQDDGEACTATEQKVVL